MYPNLETYCEDDRNYCGSFYFEKNCNQIFTAGPAKTKEILGKVNGELVPKKTYIFGRELKTKRFFLTAGLWLLFSISLFGTLLTWFTNTMDNLVLSQMILTNNTDSFRVWHNPPAGLIYNVYIFNYTNVEEYKNGMVEKLNVMELGPYAYAETLERIDVTFPTDDTISYREKRTLTFRQDLSKGHPEDLVMVPNLAVLSGSAMTKSRNYFTQLGFNAILTSMGEEAFVKITANAFLMGYHDQLYDIARNFLPDDIPQQMGVLVPKMGVSPDYLTINTGKRDMNKFGVVEKFNGETELKYFYDSKCNSVEGTDGSINPPKTVQSKKPLYFFFPDICRRVRFVFDKEETVLDGKVPAYQYKPSEDIFDSFEENPENDCYCNHDYQTCPLKGVFNMTACKYNVPGFISHPHFRRADPRFLEPFTGLNPNNNYKSYFKLHPTMGFAMEARSSFQLNIQVLKAQSVNKVAFLDDNMVLPIVVLEGVLDDKVLPREIVDVIYLTSFTIPTAKLALKYGLLLTSIITLASLVLVLKRKSQSVKKSIPDRLLRPEQEY